VIYVSILFFLAASAVTLPIFSGYFVGLCLWLWLAWRSNWRFGVITSKTGFWHSVAPCGEEDKEFFERVSSLLRPIHYGIVTFVVLSLISVLISSYFGDYAQPLSKALKPWAHQVVKNGVLWFVLSTALVAAVRKGFRPQNILWPLAVWLVVLAIYVTVQRSTGIDWVHGLSARLPPTRYAYGVYRISGLMGHPLSLSYNLMLLCLFAGAFVVDAKKSAACSILRSPWLVIGGLSLYMLLISGSRFPLGVIAVTILVGQGRTVFRALWRYKFVTVLAVVGLCLFLWLEGSVIGRFAELFDQTVPLTQRFQRLVFWQVHSQMALDHPFSGVGLAGYDQARVAYYTAVGQHDNMYTAHNIFLQILADSGIWGFAGLLFFLVGFQISAKRARKLGAGLALSLILIGTLLSGLMQNNLRDSEYLFALWFLLAWGVVHAAELRPYNSSLNIERNARE
jgi:O-antigen ligase